MKLRAYALELRHLRAITASLTSDSPLLIGNLAFLYSLDRNSWVPIKFGPTTVDETSPVNDVVVWWVIVFFSYSNLNISVFGSFVKCIGEKLRMARASPTSPSHFELLPVMKLVSEAP